MYRAGMTRFQSLLFSDNPRQALRIKRFFMALSSYVMASIIVLYSVSEHMLPSHIVPVFFGVALAGNLAIYAIFRLGLNLKVRDPSLTIPQMLFATVVIMYVLYYADQARGTYLVMFMITFVFGVFQLNTRQFMLVVAFVLVCFGIMAALLFQYRYVFTDMRLTLMQWVVLALVLPWFAWLGGYITKLRHQLKKSNAELQRALVRIQQMVSYDDLTGVHNRRFLMERLQNEKNRVDRVASRFVLILIDVDHFKRINDTYGHLVGDHVLRSVAQLVQGSLRGHDSFGRYGGEEFLLILPDTTLEAAAQVAERLRLRIQDMPCEALPAGSKVTVSMGLTEYRLHETLSSCIHRADTAMYEAKQSGRNRLVVVPRGTA
jgi:diguanylate cyclase (GGDEF)-like protein